jgi:hypothetical protein
MKKIYLLFLIVFLSAFGSAQEPVQRKNLTALRITAPLRIDGIIDEEVYAASEPAKDFVQLEPYNGRPSYQPSEVYFFYDHNAIYIGAILYDSSPDSIYNFLSERDNVGNSDYFGVYFDPYNQGQLAFGFFITPAGVQTDLKAIKSSGGDEEDSNWNAVWESKTVVNEKGWVVEMRIPYSALRFTEESTGSWGLNIFRNIRRYNSNNSWNKIDVEVSGFIHQQGNLNGISNIKPPVRFSLSPYAAAYSIIKDGNSPDMVYKGGMDLKYGINESFTLDMMLIPDFGQIQSDDQELNLSPYELYYSEKRQFFTEGTELFDRSGLLYSRRIGARPKFSNKAEDDLHENEIVDYLPTETQLINATKISGRTQNGCGLGVLNAMTLPSNALLKDTVTGNERNILVQPFTNYNMTVLDRSLPNNSFIGVMNSSVLMSGSPFIANVSGTHLSLRNKAKSLAMETKAMVSIRNEEDKETGYFLQLDLKKNSGRLQYNISQSINSDKFNINDLGYMKRNNEMTTSAEIFYQVNEPFSIFRNYFIYGGVEHSRVYDPGRPSVTQIAFDGSAQFRNNYGAEVILIFLSDKYDYYMPRVKGRYYFEPRAMQYKFYFYTDSRKPLVASAGFTKSIVHDISEFHYSVNSNLDLRIGRRCQLSYGFNLDNDINDRGYIDKSGDSVIYFARRDVRTFENVLGSSFILTNKAGISLRIRHYWSGAANKEYFRLQQDGSLLQDPAYTDDKDANYNAINLDLIFRWIFSPGSELSIAWKNSILDDASGVVIRNYLENLNNTLKADQCNSFSLKLLYYIDYSNLRKKA